MLQHPEGTAAEAALTQNLVTTDMTESRLLLGRYLERLVRLARPDRELEGSRDPPWEWRTRPRAHDDKAGNLPRVNHGVPIRAILKDLRERQLAWLLPCG